MEETKSNNGYGKRPMWQWVAIYVVIAAILYGAFYYFFLAKKGYNSNQSYNAPTTAASPTPEAMISKEMTVTLLQKIIQVKQEPQF